MLALKYTKALTPEKPEPSKCGQAARLLMSMVSLAAAGTADEAIPSLSCEFVDGGGDEMFDAQIGYPELKRTFTPKSVADTLTMGMAFDEPKSFETWLPWPCYDSSVSQTVIIPDFLAALADQGDASIGLPVMRLLQKASEWSGGGEVTDELVCAILCSYYSSFDDNFSTVFYPSAYKMTASPDAFLFELPLAMSRGAALTGMEHLTATNIWLGMMLTSDVSCPSLAADFVGRTGYQLGIAPKSVEFGGEAEFDDMTELLAASMEDLMPKFYGSGPSCEPTSSLAFMIADYANPRTPVSVQDFVDSVYDNVGDEDARLAWRDYCTKIGSAYVGSMSSARTDHYPRAVCNTAEFQRVLASQMHAAPGLDYRFSPMKLLVGTAAYLDVFESGHDVPGGVVELTPPILSVTPTTPQAPTMKMPLFAAKRFYDMTEGGSRVLTGDDVVRALEPMIAELGMSYSPDGAEMVIGSDLPVEDSADDESWAILSALKLDSQAADIILATYVLYEMTLQESPALLRSMRDGMYAYSLVLVCEALSQVRGRGLLRAGDDVVAAMSLPPFDPRYVVMEGLAQPAPSSNGVDGTDAPFREIARVPERKIVLRRERAGVNEKTRKTKALDAFCTDMVELAARGEIGEEIVGRESEIENIEMILSRRDKPNPMLLAPAGSGKTALVEAIAWRIAHGESPLLNGMGLRSLDLPGLIADGNVANLPDKIEKIVQEATATNTMLFIDEAHLIPSTGSGEFNVGNVLKPYLARSGFRIIGATTEKEFNASIAKDRALARRFSSVFVPTLGFEQVVSVLSHKSRMYGGYHGVAFPAGDKMYATMAMLAEDYMGDRESPDRELDVLDMSATVAQSLGKSVVEEPDVVKAVKLLTSNKGVKTRAEIAAELIGAPDTGAAYSRDSLDEMFPTVAGQWNAKEKIARQLATSRLGLSTRRRPKNVFMFVGKSGVGKTYMATEMAPLLDAEPKDVMTIPLGDYKDRASNTRLVGASPQYIGYNEGGQLTNFIKAHPNGVVILDEIDKCHPEIRDMFLGVFDTGELRAADGSSADCTSITFVCTSNAGTEGYSKPAIGFGSVDSSPEAGLMDALKETYGEPLMNRIDEVVMFDSLGDDDLLDICSLGFHKLSERMEVRFGVDLEDAYGEDKMLGVARELLSDPSSRYDARTIWSSVEKRLKPELLSALGNGA